MGQLVGGGGPPPPPLQQNKQQSPPSGLSPNLNNLSFLPLPRTENRVILPTHAPHVQPHQLRVPNPRTHTTAQRSPDPSPARPKPPRSPPTRPKRSGAPSFAHFAKGKSPIPSKTTVCPPSPPADGNQFHLFQKKKKKRRSGLFGGGGKKKKKKKVLCLLATTWSRSKRRRQGPPGLPLVGGGGGGGGWGEKKKNAHHQSAAWGAIDYCTPPTKFRTSRTTLAPSRGSTTLIRQLEGGNPPPTIIAMEISILTYSMGGPDSKEKRYRKKKKKNRSPQDWDVVGGKPNMARGIGNDL